MRKLQVDHDHSLETGARLKRYTQIEKNKNPSQSSKTLQRRVEPQTSDKRMAEFLKIDRRKTS